MHERIQGRIPYECPIFLYRQEWLVRQPNHVGNGSVRLRQLVVDNLDAAAELRDRLARTQGLSQS
jgi:hypothetical protein